ncbi:endo alpha-1,4 polygalactosaminidase [soil metagenome]
MKRMRYTNHFKGIVFIISFLILSACKKQNTEQIDYREEMRLFVEEISSFSRTQHPGFIIIPQNGQALLNANPDGSGNAQNYFLAIDGLGREELFYGYDNMDNLPTPSADHLDWLGPLQTANSKGKKILVTDYCSEIAKVNDSYQQNHNLNFISFAADQRELTSIPSFPVSPYEENVDDIDSLPAAKNFLYLINTSTYPTKLQFLDAISQTNYDVILMDAFFQENDSSSLFTPTDLAIIRHKKNGGKRLLIAYMSIGEAEDYRYYWKQEWISSPPSWLGNLNSQWAGNYKVKYWQEDWKNKITGNADSYNQRIINAGFDGLYLDIVDAFEYFEEQ